MENIIQDRFLITALAAVCGAILGSFATALIWRLPRDIDWKIKRSSCTKCGYKLKALDLLPILSYIISGGKCRNCGANYGVKYLVIELLMLIGFALIFYFVEDLIIAALLSLLYFAVIVLSVIDFEHYIIPNEVNIFIFILSISYAIYINAPWQQIVLNPFFYMALSLFLRWFMYAWKKKEALGLGDVKFFFAVGAFLELELLSPFLFMSGFIGIVIAIIWRIKGYGKKFPFGPALSMSLFLCVAFPEIGDYMLKMTQETIYN